METIAKYTLRSKDKPLVHFCLQSELEEAFGEKQYRYQISILETIDENKELLPLPLKNKLDNSNFAVVKPPNYYTHSIS